MLIKKLNADGLVGRKEKKRTPRKRPRLAFFQRLKTETKNGGRHEKRIGGGSGVRAAFSGYRTRKGEEFLCKRIADRREKFFLKGQARPVS